MLSVGVAALGVASFFFWVYLEYTPLWLEWIMGYDVLFGPEAPWLQELLMAVKRGVSNKTVMVVRSPNLAVVLALQNKCPERWVSTRRVDG